MSSSFSSSNTREETVFSEGHFHANTHIIAPGNQTERISHKMSSNIYDPPLLVYLPHQRCHRDLEFYDNRLINEPLKKKKNLLMANSPDSVSFEHRVHVLHKGLFFPLNDTGVKRSSCPQLILSEVSVRTCEQLPLITLRSCTEAEDCNNQSKEIVLKTDGFHVTEEGSDSSYV